MSNTASWFLFHLSLHPQWQQQCREQAVESVFLKALRRWFGVIFWFAVLGVAGAFLYRIVDWLADAGTPKG